MAAGSRSMPPTKLPAWSTLAVIALALGLSMTILPNPPAGNAAPASTGTDAPSAIPPPPQVTAPSWAVYDTSDMQLLGGVQPESARPIASLTKLMTALLVVERTTGDEKVSISRAAERVGDGSEIGMKAGDTYPVDKLLEAMLGYSANDAAVALAEHVSGSQRSFIELMNKRAAELKLGATRFTTVHGLDASPMTTSSPADLAVLATTALKDERIARAASATEVTISRPDGTRVRLPNRNELLGRYEGVDGVKTGFTDRAGYCLVTRWTGKLDAAGSLLVVVLGDRSRTPTFADTRLLLDWARELRRPFTVAAAGEPVARVPLQGSTGTATVYVADEVRPNLRVGDHLSERVVVPSVLRPPLREGDFVGRYEALIGGKVVGSSRVYVARDLREPSLAGRLRSAAGEWRVAARAGLQVARRDARRFMEYWGF